MGKLDETIEKICDWIQEGLREDQNLSSTVPAMISALAQLVSAGAASQSISPPEAAQHVNVGIRQALSIQDLKA